MRRANARASRRPQTRCQQAARQQEAQQLQRGKQRPVSSQSELLPGHLDDVSLQDRWDEAGTLASAASGPILSGSGGGIFFFW